MSIYMVLGTYNLLGAYLVLDTIELGTTYGAGYWALGNLSGTGYLAMALALALSSWYWTQCIPGTGKGGRE